MTNRNLHDCCREVTVSPCVQTSAWASCSGDDDNNDDDNDNDNVQWHHHGRSPEHGQQRGQLLRRQPTSTAGGQETTSSARIHSTLLDILLQTKISDGCIGVISVGGLVYAVANGALLFDWVGLLS